MDRPTGFLGSVARLAEINTALDGMTFTPLANYSGAANMNLYVNDFGNTGTGGPDRAAVGMNIWVYAAGMNDSPIYVGLSNSSIAENQTSGTTVGALYAIDPDVGDTHTFSLVSGSGDADNHPSRSWVRHSRLTRRSITRSRTLQHQSASHRHWRALVRGSSDRQCD